MRGMRHAVIETPRIVTIDGMRSGLRQWSEQLAAVLSSFDGATPDSREYGPLRPHVRSGPKGEIKAPIQLRPLRLRNPT
jgi:hypothetical protein